MKFTTRSLLILTAIVAIVLTVAIRLPSLAAFIVCTAPLVIFLRYRGTLWARSRWHYFASAALAFTLAYVASIGPWNLLVSPTESDPDHPWTKAMVSAAKVVYAPIISPKFMDGLELVGLKRHYQSYHNDWYRYGIWAVGLVHASESTPE